MAWPRTFKNLQDLAIARLNLEATADLSVTKDAINNAYSQTVIETEAFQTGGTKTLTAGTATYDLSTFVSTGMVVRMKAVYSSFGGVQTPPLQQISLDALLRRRVGSGGTSAASGTATHYAMAGMNDLELWPTPAAADVLTFYYVYQPTALSGDSDVPTIPEPYASRCLLNGACWELADLTGDPNAGQYQADFEQWIARFRAHLNRRRGGQPGAFENYPETPYISNDPARIVSGW